MTKQEQIESLQRQVKALEDRPLERQLWKAKKDINLLCQMVQALVARGDFSQEEATYNQDKVNELITKWDL